jgi:cell division protein FtsB
MGQKERELLKMRENYEATMSKLREKKTSLEETIKGLRDQSQKNQLDITKMRN